LIPALSASFVAQCLKNVEQSWWNWQAECPADSVGKDLVRSNIDQSNPVFGLFAKLLASALAEAIVDEFRH